MYIGRKFIILDRQKVSLTAGKYPTAALSAKAPVIIIHGFTLASSLRIR